MSKVALITDTHWGVRNDSPLFAKHISNFYKEVFFPYLEEHGINYIVHLGDIVDRRKYINFVTAKHLDEDFIKPIYKNNLFLHAIIGNHDTFFKNTNEVNSMNSLYRDNCHFNYYSEPIERTIDGCKILFMPWICSGNYEQCIDAIEKTDAQVLFGHLELNGFEMYKGSPNNHGFDPKLFDKFDIVCSGHFHHKSSKGNINYLGAPYEMTWSDHDDPRGFHIFDTKTRELTFIQNHNTIFNKIEYDDTDQDLDSILNLDYSKYTDKIIKVTVKNKNNPHSFDVFIDKLEKAGVADIKVTEDQSSLNLEMDEDILKEAEDTISILNKYATQLSKTEHIGLSQLLQELYTEALSVSN
jgi:predicted phosphodiesterase